MHIACDIVRRVGTLGGQLKALRQAIGWSQAELATRAGTTQAVVSRIERGLQSPTIAMAERLHAALGARMVILSEPLAVDPVHLAHERQLPMAERLERAFAWMRFNSQLQGAAARSRAARGG